MNFFFQFLIQRFKFTFTKVQFRTKTHLANSGEMDFSRFKLIYLIIVFFRTGEHRKSERESEKDQ